jgi:hypothetical protein
MAVGTASLVVQLSALLGGGRCGFDSTKLISSLTGSHDRTVNCVGATSPTAITLWDSSVDKPTAGDLFAIVLDPDLRLSSAKSVEIEITASAQVTVYSMSTARPVLLIPARATGTALGTTAGAITKIRASCPTGTTATTDDVVVRCLVLD